MDQAFSAIAAGLIMHAVYLATFVGLAVLAAIVVCPVRAWWRWYKRRLTVR